MMEIESFLLRNCWVRYVLFLISLSLISGDGLASKKPVIHVTFELDVHEIFADQLGQDRNKLSANIIKEFITAAEDEWGFVQWSSEPASSTDKASASWRLLLRTQAVTTGNEKGWVTSLFQSYSSNGEDFVPIDQTANIEVYKLGNRDVDFQDLEQLTDHISILLLKQLTDLLHQPDVIAFMEKIPIAREIIAEKKNKALVVPYCFRDLKAGDSTQLEITFNYPPNTDQVGKLLLKPYRFVSGPESMQQYIFGKTTKLDGYLLNDVNDWWDEQFTDVFQSEPGESALVQGVRVHDYDIEDSVDSADGSVPDPTATATEEYLQCSPVNL